jgi:DNA-binding GntR family transcriptional regulator
MSGKETKRQMATQIITGLVEKRSMDRAAADVIRHAIVTASLSAGSRLTEAELAANLAVSRGTVRAALQRLTSEGLVVQKPYSGWEVTSLTSNDAWELYTLRSCLEGLAAQLAAHNPDRVRFIEAAYETLKIAARTLDHREITSADLALHKQIVSLANHNRLLNQYKYVEQQIRMYLTSSNAILQRPEQAIMKHEKLVNALLKGDAASAELEARDHARASGEVLVQHLREQEAKIADKVNTDVYQNKISQLTL